MAQAIAETVFDVLYLSFALIVGLTMLVKGKDPLVKKAGLMAALLGAGDAFHLVPRSYSLASFHQDFIRNKVTLIGCPKLDQVDYSEKLTGIIQNNNIQSVTIVRMEVPCCGGLEMAAKKALQNSGKFIPWQVVTISIDGKILE